MLSDVWKPLSAEKLNEIDRNFTRLYPRDTYGDLAREVSGYWRGMLERVWREKPEHIRTRDCAYLPSEPLSRVEQKAVIIAYADSVYGGGEGTLKTLYSFLKEHVPEAHGLHMLPAGPIVEDRFNDGYFSQVRRDAVHHRFGSEADFTALSDEYFFMADFVLNHVDIEHPLFQAYLDGDDAAGEAFYLFSPQEYAMREARGDFANIFRPRPFPLFTVMRRSPADPSIRSMNHQDRCRVLQKRFVEAGLPELPIELAAILPLCTALSRDQMLLADEAALVERLSAYLERTHGSWERVLRISRVQETRHTPYTFVRDITSPQAFLERSGVPADRAARYAHLFDQSAEELFGEEVYALTTFSHVQIDVNTQTARGLRLLADDFSWYLRKDLNMIRLDAANFAFKKWGTSCFGLPEVKLLLKILYLSMDCVAPRMIPNLEVNDRLSAVLEQMADRDNGPPMMYDFHLSALIPLVFQTSDVTPLARIQRVIDRYNIPRHRIRFSLAESHDGKSLRGSWDMMTDAERELLARCVRRNGGAVKYRATVAGQEPYELCISTRDILRRDSETELPAPRYLAFYTLAFALMGRNVKAVYFNDLFGLPNDTERVRSSGELRDIKRTKLHLKRLLRLLRDDEFTRLVFEGMRQLINIVESDPAVSPQGMEARIDVPAENVALITCRRGDAVSLIIVNVGERTRTVSLHPDTILQGRNLFDRLNAGKVYTVTDDGISLKAGPYARFWLST